MKKKFCKRVCFCGVFLLLVTVCYPKLNAQAYVLNGAVCPTPGSIEYSIGTSVAGFISEIGQYVEVWEDYCPELGISSVAFDGYIRFTGELNTSNGYFAVWYNKGHYQLITLYNDYANAPSAQRYEVIVHEVGHALGLAHCQEEKNSESVMRALGFNYKAYPLSDDIAGITALYGQ